MYDLTNHHIQMIIPSIDQGFVSEYDWLAENLQQAATETFQRLSSRCL